MPKIETFFDMDRVCEGETSIRANIDNYLSSYFLFIDDVLVFRVILELDHYLYFDATDNQNYLR